MSYGIKVLNEDSTLALHSDYSSMVYLGECVVHVDPTQIVYDATYAVTPSTSQFYIGYTTQYRFNVNTTTFVLPFYLPDTIGQKVGVLDYSWMDGYWVLNVLHSGSIAPRLFLFTPRVNISRATSDYGLLVKSPAGSVVFDSGDQLLKIDSVATVNFPDSIRNTGNNFIPTTIGTTDTITYNSDNIYSAMPAAYGGGAYSLPYSYDSDCNCFSDIFGNTFCFSHYTTATLTTMWASYRGVLSISNTGVITPSFLCDYAGHMYASVQGACTFGGILGKLINDLFSLGSGGAIVAPTTLASMSPFAPNQVFYDSEVCERGPDLTVMVSRLSYYL